MLPGVRFLGNAPEIEGGGTVRTFKRYILPMLLVLIAAEGFVVAKKPPRDVFGLRIGMDEEAAHKRLRKIATQERAKRKKDGEQELWILKSDSRFDYVITRFNREHQLTSITVVALPNRVRYADVASSSNASIATDGRNFSYKWKVAGEGQRKGVLLIARGSSEEYLTSYSLYPVK